MISDIQVGNAPCSWGTLEFSGAESGRVDCDEMLAQIAATEYTGCDLGDWGFLPTEPEPLAAKFNRHGLTLTGAFVPVALRHKSAQQAGMSDCLKVATLLHRTSDLLGSRHEPYLVLADDNGTDPARTQHAGRIVSSFGQKELGLSADEWHVFASGAESIARAVHDETGLRTVFHHHCAGFVETPHEIDTLLDLTDPACLGLVFDTGHYAFGADGCDGIIEAMNRYASRIWYVHLKDLSPDVLSTAHAENWDYFAALRNGVFCELGKGCVDFPAVHAWLQRLGYTGYVTVEQDLLPGMGTPEESARRNRAYLRSIGL